MTTRTGYLFLCALALGCGGASHASPTLASQAHPLALGAAASGELASACDRTVWSFHPTSAGNYRFEAQSDVPMSLRLFSTDPDLYLDTGRTNERTATLEARLDPDATYAVTLAGTDCRATHYAISIASAD